MDPAAYPKLLVGTLEIWPQRMGAAGSMGVITDGTEDGF